MSRPRRGYRDASDPSPREEALKNAFGWTRYPGHGPGDELLGDPLTTLALGFGRGDAVAALATKGITATGLDISPVHTERARERWGHLPGAHFERGNVLEYLADTDRTRTWDAIYSIWGAVWFTDPQELLPLIHRRLAPGGHLVFSHAPAVPGCYGVQGKYGNGFTGLRTWVYRWAYEPDAWTGILHEHGFTTVQAHVEPAPEPERVGTLIVQARRART